MRAYIVTPTFEPALIAELGPAHRPRQADTPGVVLDDGGGDPGGDPIFARQILPDATLLEAPSVRPLAEAAYQVVEAAIDAGDQPFTLQAFTPPRPPELGDEAGDDGPGAPDAPRTRWRRAARPGDGRAPTGGDGGLGSRVELVGRQLLELLRERRRRAFRRYRAYDDAAPVAGGLVVQLLALDRTRLVVSAAVPRALPHGGTDIAPWPGGAAPVAVDRRPPSRAYRKLEEAFLWMGAAPARAERVVDLGGAPGGWAYASLRRGARVTAVDRAALAPPAAGHAGLDAVIGNAFTFEPAAPPVAWLTCDVICEPARSLALIARWVEQRWCHNLAVTVKFKGKDGYGILSGVPPIFARAGWRFARVKHLVHNRNEVTVMARES